MNQIGNDFFASAALASDKDGNIAGSNLLDGAHHRLHRVTLKHRRSGAAHGGERPTKGAVLLVLLLVLDGALDGHQQSLSVERLIEEMISAALGGLDGGVEGGIAGQHNDLAFGPLFFYLRQKIQSVSVGQFDVQQDDVGLRFGKELF